MAQRVQNHGVTNNLACLSSCKPMLATIHLVQSIIINAFTADDTFNLYSFNNQTVARGLQYRPTRGVIAFKAFDGTRAGSRPIKWSELGTRLPLTLSLKHAFLCIDMVAYSCEFRTHLCPYRSARTRPPPGWLTYVRRPVPLVKVVHPT
jgi:hypothetical protein